MTDQLIKLYSLSIANTRFINEFFRRDASCYISFRVVVTVSGTGNFVNRYLSGMEHKIEQAGEADFREITEVWEASVRATHDFLTEEDIRFYKPLILNEYLKAVKLYCVRNAAGNIAGFMGIADNKLEMLFVHPAARGTGIGKTLLSYAITHEKVTAVDVNEQNGQAVGFYLHEGFKILSRSATDGMGKPFPILSMGL
jgi:putative acetyltransferase